MKPLHLAVLGAILVVAAVLILLSTDDDGRRVRESGRTTASDAGRARGEGADGEDAGTTAVPAGDLAVTLKVVGPDGEPASGAELVVGRRRETADSDGAGRVDGLAPGFYDLFARLGGAVGSRSFELEETTDLGVLELARSVEIRGHVYDAQGRPVRGAAVEAVIFPSTQTFDFSRMIESVTKPDAIGAATTSGDDGAYELRVPKSGTFALRVVAAGFAPEHESARAYHDDVERLDFYLFPGTAVSGVVVDADGNGIAGARVMVLSPMEMFTRRVGKTEATTDADGRFAISVVPAANMMATVRAAGYASHIEQLTLPSTDMRITLERGARLRLRTINAKDSVPIVGVAVLVNYRGGFAQGRTGAGGELVIENLPTKATTAMGGQQQAFFIGGGGSVPKLLSITEEPKDGLLDLGDIQLDIGGVVRGRVLDAATKTPLAGAGVRALGGLDMQLQFLGSMPTLSNEAGEFELTGVPLGANLLIGQHPDYITNANPMAFAMMQMGKPLFEEGKTEAEKDVMLVKAAELAGVVTGPNGAPVSGAVVKVQMGQEQVILMMLGGGVPEAVTDAAGKFLLRGLKNGLPQKLVASHRDFGSSEPLTVKPGNGDSVALALTQPIQIVGTVVDEQGAAVDGVRVTVQRKKATSNRGMVNPMSTMEQGTTRPAVTDDKGAFALRNAPAGDLELTFDHPQYQPQTREARSHADTPMLDTERTTLMRGLGIEGVVVDAKGAPVVGITVMATQAQLGQPKPGAGRRYATSMTDEEGRFSMFGLDEGDYTVQPYKLGTYGEQRKVPTGTTDLRLLARPAAELKGRVMAAGQPVFGASVQAQRANVPDTEYMRKHIASTQTDAKGEFTLTPLPPDEDFVLEVRHDGYRTLRVEGVVGGGNVRDFTLDAGAQVGGIVVDANGNPVQTGLMVRVGDDAKWVRTKVDGTWVAGGLGEGEITVQVTADSGFIKQEPLVVAPGETNLRIAVERGESISGTIVGEFTSETRTLQIEAVAEDGTVAANVWIAQGNSEFMVEGLPKGRYTLRASRWHENKFEVLGEAGPVAAGAIDVQLKLR
ncbi:MAG: carboxypeptidase regulatory-like domain-containing protein [Planctomycetota bacterium]|jgi:uncharacterized GH25 family protein